MSKWTLFGAMAKDGTAWVSLPDGRKGILQAVQRESGSGDSFIVTLLVDGRPVKACVRTND